MKKEIMIITERKNKITIYIKKKGKKNIGLIVKQK